MSKLESAKKAASIQNAEAISSTSSPATSTADIAGLTLKVEDMAVKVEGLTAAIRTATSPVTSTADIAGLTLKVEGMAVKVECLTEEVTSLRAQVTLMQATAEATQERVISIHRWIVYIGRWVEFVKKHGLYVEHLVEVMGYLRVISNRLKTANIGPNKAIMQEMIAPTVEVAKRIGKETRSALRVSGLNQYRVAITTAASFVLFEIAARMAGVL